MKRFCLLFLSLLMLPGLCALGQTRVRGTVTDAQTGEPLPYVSVIFPGTPIAGRVWYTTLGVIVNEQGQALS